MSTPSMARHRGRRGLIEILMNHGLTELAAHAVVALGEALRLQMLQEPDPDRRRENGGVLDARTGEQYGPIAAGTRTGVSFAAPIAVAREREPSDMVGVHTHPGSSSFSEGDARLLAEASPITAMVVTGADGTWYVLSLEPGATRPFANEIEERYHDVFDHLAPAYQALIYSGSLTEEQAWQDLTHETWEIIAPGLYLRYDRIAPVDGIDTLDHIEGAR